MAAITSSTTEITLEKIPRPNDVERMSGRSIPSSTFSDRSRPHSIPKPEPLTLAMQAAKKPMAAAMPPITGITTRAPTQRKSAPAKTRFGIHAEAHLESWSYLGTPEPHSPLAHCHGRLRNKLLGLRLSLGSGPAAPALGAPHTPQNLSLSPMGATLRAEHRIIPSYFERITWIAKTMSLASLLPNVESNTQR